MALSLFIDGKNTAYRALFASKGNQESTGSGYHPFVVWLRFVRMWIEKFKPTAVHVFWDCPKNEVWRKRLYPKYKDNRDSNSHLQEVADEMAMMVRVGIELLPYLNTRVYRRDRQEADDLIYSACRVITPEKAIVISSDGDMLQLPWNMAHISCYEPRLNKMLNTPDVSPVMQKALMGDTSDNIEGYRGIGEVKSKQLCLDRRNFAEFLKVKGDLQYKLNSALIDLSLNPHRLNNDLYVQHMLAKPPIYDRDQVVAKIAEYKIRGLHQEFSRVIVPFKLLNEQSQT